MRAVLALALLALGPAARAAGFVPADSLDFSATPAEIARDCAQARRRAESSLAVLAALPPTARSFDNTVWALDLAVSGLSDDTASDAFLAQVAVSSATRRAARKCDALISRFDAGVYGRADLYAAVRQYARTRPALRGEDARLLEKTLQDFKRAGLDLPEPARARLRAVRARLAELEVQFARGIAEDGSSALLTRAGLAGLPEAFVAGLPREGGLYRVAAAEPGYAAFMEDADDPAARRILQEKFDDRAARTNLPLLDQALSLRLEEARLLGYPDHDAFVLEPAMAKTPRAAWRFLEGLRRRLRPQAERELAVLDGLKREREGPRAGPVRAWDWRRYDHLLRESKGRVDAVREYFPSDLVLARLMDEEQSLLGVRFREVPDAAVWDSSVRLFSVADAGGGPPLGYFYLDLYARPGKLPRAAAFPLIAGRLRSDGTYRTPVSALLADFDEPSPERPSLLGPGQVETLIREFGRVMQQTLTKARYGRFSGSRAARDFADAPSQALAQSAWDPGVLRSLSGWYKDRSQPLPEALADRLIAAHGVDAALKTLRQVFFAEVDQEYHGRRPPADPTRAYARLQKKVALIPMTPGTHPEASFGHLMEGYDSAYYGYLWSRSLAADMASVLRAQGPTDPGAGRRFRTEVLEKGSSRPEEESLAAFLGRAPSDAAFLKSLEPAGAAR